MLRRKPWFVLIMSACLVLALSLQSPAGDDEFAGLVRKGLGELGAKAGEGLCVITDAPYVQYRGKSAVVLTDVLTRETGCSLGRGNLLFLQRPLNSPVLVGIFDGKSKKMWVMSLAGDREHGEIWDLGKEAMSAPGASEAMMKTPLGKAAGSFVPVALAWDKGAPYEFLKCAEPHNHLCPGVTSGYMLAKYVLSHYPLAPGERYFYLAAPVWCKEDAVQVLMDLTPGKHGMGLADLTDEEKKDLSEPALAGIFLIWDAKAQKGRAVAMLFDWDLARKQAGVPDSSSMANRMAILDALLPRLENPGDLVRVWKEYPLTPELYKKLTTPGRDPYRELEEGQGKS